MKTNVESFLTWQWQNQTILCLITVLSAHTSSMPITLLTVMIIDIWRDLSWATEPYIQKHGKPLWNLKEKKKWWCQIAKTNYRALLCYVNRTKSSAINYVRSYCTITFFPEECKIKITVIHRYTPHTPHCNHSYDI